MKFKYKCGAPNGDIVEDYIEASSQEEAKKRLEAQNYYVFELKKEKSENSLFSGKGKKEVIPFTKMFYVLLKSGMEIINILEVLVDQIESEKYKASVKTIIKDVKSGQTLADSMRVHPLFFSEFYCSAVDAGEKTGSLAVTFNRLYAYLKSQEKIKAKIKLAMIYPSFLISFAFIVVLFLSLYVLPSFAKIYSSFGKQVPAITRVVLDISQFVKSYWIIMVVVTTGLFFLGRKLLKNPANREKFDIFILKLGKISDFIYRKEITAIFRTLSLSISSGMDIIKSLGIARDSSVNTKIRKDFARVIELVSQGEKLSFSLKGMNIPRMAIQMIAAGEESNNLEEMLDNVSEFYEEEMENAISGLMGFIEPMLILLVGGVIGFIIIAMLMPILTLSTAIS